MYLFRFRGGSTREGPSHAHCPTLPLKVKHILAEPLMGAYAEPCPPAFITVSEAKPIVWDKNLGELNTCRRQKPDYR